MGIFERFKKDQPGQDSQPGSGGEDGPLTLEDRTEPGATTGVDANQAKTEPMSPTGTHSEPLAVPDLDQMSAGAAGAAQAPSHPAAAQTSPSGSYGGGAVGEEPKGLGGPGTRPDQDRPDVDTTTSTGRAHGPVNPVSTTSGEAHRAGGLNGVSPEGEQIESDTEAGATRMGAAPPDAVPGVSSGHGDTGPSPSTGDAAAPGTSETQPKVEGIRLPDA